VIGNHDGNWGSGWYPDPCGGGICGLLGLDSAGIAATYVDHGDVLDVPGFAPQVLNHGDICGLEQGDSGHPEDFYYSFSFRNAYFIALHLDEDFSGMLDCNGGGGEFGNCAEYCSAPELRLDPARNSDCYRVHQYDWLTTELMAASARYEHVFVFAHAPLLGSGENHLPNSDAPSYRALFDEYGVDAYFNGHNHAYERTVPVRGGVEDADGTHYVTVGTGGAFTDTISGNEFTAHSYREWTTYGDYEQMTTYLRVHVDGAGVTASVVTLAGDSVDEFTID
ncbi:MAG: metallophosphoesterase, partial [Nannocystaceae bacterium]|nr:metallophosphoesterase [Nannocystaceae bacterium]